MGDRQYERMKKQQRDIKILIILGVFAFIFMIISLSIALSSDEGNQPLVTPPNNIEQGEGDTEGEKNENESEKEDTTQTDDAGQVTETVTDNPKETDTKKATGVIAEGTKTHTNKKTNVSYTFPKSWDGLVEFYEDRNLVEFFYKGEALFLSILTITHTDYKVNKDYYDSFYSIAHSAEQGLVLYGLPNEHPLAREEGSDDYKKLSVIMSDNYNFIQTIKAK